MKISEWLDKKEADGVDVSQIILPDELSYDEVTDEPIFFKEIDLPPEHVPHVKLEFCHFGGFDDNRSNEGKIKLCGGLSR